MLNVVSPHKWLCGYQRNLTVLRRVKRTHYLMTMKKILSFATAILLAIPAFAQKPAAGSVAVEGTVSSIFGNSFGINTGSQGNIVSGLRGRYFLSDDLAARVTVGVGIDSDGSFTVGGNQGTLDETVFGISLGIEKHFAGTNRLSPYIGGDLLIRNEVSNWEINDAGPAANGSITEVKNFGGNGSFKFGLQGVVGADYYVVDNVFIGVEFGLQFVLDSPKDIETTVKGAGTSTAEAADGTFNFNTNYVTGLRFGFVF